MSRSTGVGAASSLFLVLALAACGSSGVKTQSDSPTPTSSAPTSSTAAPSGSVTSSPTAAPSTTGFGSAQPAVDIVLQVQTEYATAVRDPAHNSTSKLDVLLAGQAKTAFDGAFASAKTAGVIYKGTQPTARIKVTSNQASGSVPEVVLVDCPLQSDSAPFVAYYAATGKPVPTPSAAVKPPYAQTAKVFKVNGRWVVTQFSTNATETCSV